MREPGAERKPTHCIRLGRGNVTHFGNHPITSRAMAERVRNLIWETTGEDGEIAEVVASISLPAAEPATEEETK